MPKVIDLTWRCYKSPLHHQREGKEWNQKVQEPGILAAESKSEPRNNLVKTNIPSHTYSLLATAMVPNVDVVEDLNMEAEELS
jgi:hypothetical protein